MRGCRWMARRTGDPEGCAAGLGDAGANLPSKMIRSRCRHITECAVTDEKRAMEPLRVVLVVFILDLPICQYTIGLSSFQSILRPITME